MGSYEMRHSGQHTEYHGQNVGWPAVHYEHGNDTSDLQSIAPEGILYVLDDGTLVNEFGEYVDEYGDPIYADDNFAPVINTGPDSDEEIVEVKETDNQICNIDAVDEPAQLKRSLRRIKSTQALAVAAIAVGSIVFTTSQGGTEQDVKAIGQQVEISSSSDLSLADNDMPVNEHEPAIVAPTQTAIEIIPAQPVLQPFEIHTYNVHDKVLSNTDGMASTLQYVREQMQGSGKVLGLQELRGASQAKHFAENMPLCPDPNLCDSDGYVPLDGGGSVGIIWDNERFELAEPAVSFKLHESKDVKNEKGNKIHIAEKWQNITLLKDKQSGSIFFFSSTHLVRSIQKNGELNLKAPQIMELLNIEMTAIQNNLKAYIDRGLSGFLVMDGNYHDNLDPNAPPGVLASIGFKSIYSPDVADLTPEVQGTHYSDNKKIKGRNVDVMYAYIAKEDPRTNGLNIVWRKNLGTSAPSDHNYVVAGIDIISNQ